MRTNHVFPCQNTILLLNQRGHVTGSFLIKLSLCLLFKRHKLKSFTWNSVTKYPDDINTLVEKIIELSNPGGITLHLPNTPGV